MPDENRDLRSIADELRQFSDDEGVESLKKKFDKWIDVLDELTELRVPHVGMAFMMVKELYRMCTDNGAFAEVRYEVMTAAEFDTWTAAGPCIKLGSNEAGYTLQRGAEFVSWFADSGEFRRILGR